MPLNLEPLTSNLKLVMTATVRDEADLLADWLHFHRAEGVGHFLILDHRSTDDTPEILAHYAQLGWLSYWQESGLAYRQGQWVTALARLAFSQFQADWVINNDVDEFWVSDSGSLQQTLARVPEQYRVVRAVRHNFAALLPDPTRPFWQHQSYRFSESQNFIGAPLSGKVCHRGSPEIIVHHGNHSVSPMAPEDIGPENALEVLHVPARSYEQFERKIRNGGAALAASGEPVSTGQAKRDLYDLYLQGRLPDWYRQWAYTPEKLAQALSTGDLETDTRLQNRFTALEK